MDMSVGHLPRMQEERRTMVQGAVIAGSVVAAVVIAVPAGLLELVLASVGLSEFLPALAPPIGWPVRTGLALLAAIVAAAISAGWTKEEKSRSGSAPDGKGDRVMSWTQSLGLHHLVRLARGDTGTADHRVAISPAMRAPRFRRSPQEKVQDALARHRADLHPDAPPRAPLMASLDLPPVAGLTLVENMPETAPAPEPRPRLASAVRDITGADRPRPLPRSPEPLSDADLSRIHSLLDEEQGATVQETASAPEMLAPISAILPEIVVRSSSDDSLASMLDRFEQGVAHRIALRDAADAQIRVEDSLAEVDEPATAETVIAEAPAEAVVTEQVATPATIVDGPSDDDLGIDDALNAALETLRKLSAKANGR